jgi:GR25 family glycosyltransferase involved in LPS biosynthesis
MKNIKDIPILVINLLERVERLNKTYDELIYYGFRFINIKIINGQPITDKFKTPAMAIGEAHLNCIREAKKSGWSEVLICEDDIEFSSPDSLEHLNKAFNELPDDWQLFSGGNYYMDGYKEPEKGNLIKLGVFCSTHFYIARNTIYDYMLTFDGKQHIDQWLNLGGNKIQAYSVYPICVLRRPDFSDQLNKQVDYSDMLKERGYKVLR